MGGCKIERKLCSLSEWTCPAEEGGEGRKEGRKEGEERREGREGSSAHVHERVLVGSVYQVHRLLLHHRLVVEGDQMSGQSTIKLLILGVQHEEDEVKPVQKGESKEEEEEEMGGKGVKEVVKEEGEEGVEKDNEQLRCRSVSLRVTLTGGCEVAECSPPLSSSHPTETYVGWLLLGWRCEH